MNDGDRAGLSGLPGPLARLLASLARLASCRPLVYAPE